MHSKYPFRWLARFAMFAPFARAAWAVRFRRAVAVAVSAVLGAAAIAAGSSALHRGPQFSWHVSVAAGDYQDRAARAVSLLEREFYNGTGLWHMCVPLACNTKNRDWGSDSLTYVLYLRWLLTRDPSVPPIMATLADTAHAWVPADAGSSDTVMWDAIADAREYQVTGRPAALAKARQAFRWVDSVMARGFASGACPGIDYQWPYGRGGGLKTLETATNYIKAALLLHEITGSASYLAKAEVEYRHVRRYFLVGKVPLYTVYVFDDGAACRPLPGRYFASVNGNMIWAGSALAADTGHPGYLRQAIATAASRRAGASATAPVYADLGPTTA
jgi:hypothetical protein